LTSYTPYSDFPARAFWRTGAGNSPPELVQQLSDCRSKLKRSEGVMTAGSCFAQHISRRLRRMGYKFLDEEPAPPWLDATAQRDFGYGIFSARYGNIYTSRQLKQLLFEAFGKFTPAERVWDTGGRYYDPFRPTIETGGFDSAEEVLISRETLLMAVRRLVKTADVFVFTLGLTECWQSKQDGAVYPTCPGAHAGTFDPDRHEFLNLSVSDVKQDLKEVFALMRRARPSIRFILTVSPVPLTATASGQHVLTATTQSKATLRAAAGEMQARFDFVDYFPSYELVTAPSFGGRFYAANKREVTEQGVNTVMNMFEREFCEDGKAELESASAPVEAVPAEAEVVEDVLCDERILEFYASR
jgi:hypothetical protein